MAVINTLVEGDLDEAAASKLILKSNHVIGVSYGKHGCGYIRRKIRGFNRACRSLHFLTLIDFMDTGSPCPGSVVRDWLPRRNSNMLFRVVVRELESWFIADPVNLADFLGIDPKLIPANPEDLVDPKRQLVNLARRSRSKRIRSALVPERGSTAQVGKLYNSEMKRFIDKHWDLTAARTNAHSLDRCMKALESIVDI